MEPQGIHARVGIASVSEWPLEGSMMTARRIRQFLFELPDGATVKEVRAALFEVKEQDAEIHAGDVAAMMEATK